MTEFFFLIPISLLLGAIGLGVFLWSLKSDQYADLDGAAQRLLYEEDAPLSASPSPATNVPPPAR